MRNGTLAAALILFSCLPGAKLIFAVQAPSVEAQVKAAFLYNFAQFIQWPSGAFADKDVPFTMCVAEEGIQGVLEKIVSGESLDGRRIEVKKLASPDAVRGCHLVYVGSLDSRRSLEIITAADRAAILTVGDSQDFINVGGMIRFTEAEHRVRFEINLNAAERASLRVSSRLLRLADIVRPREGAVER